MGRKVLTDGNDLMKKNPAVSERWLEPNTEGPHAHEHAEAHLFYVLDGSLSVYVHGKDWFEARWVMPSAISSLRFHSV